MQRSSLLLQQHTLEPWSPPRSAWDNLEARLQTQHEADTLRDALLTLQMHRSRRSLCGDTLISSHISGDELETSELALGGRFALLALSKDQKLLPALLEIRTSYSHRAVIPA